MRKVISWSITFFFTFYFMLSEVSGQPTLNFDLKKPQKYENKQLGSEKSADKKFTTTRKFVQNTVTHYNWYFNANNRLNEVIERAKLAHQDDFTELLSFYNYTLDLTQRDSIELDSVIYKANAGILIHDLRNSWIDNLYMLMGKAYFFRQQLDSAYLTFQYINYAFSPKEKDGYDKPIGSNATEGGSAFIISTKENNSLPKKIISTPPSRNESFIWQIRTFIENGDMGEAASLIETLRLDPQFPERLKTDLNEVRALYFYRQQSYDSAAFYLQHALGNAANKREQARWEFLIGQLYERAGKHQDAEQYFQKAVAHTLDPVLDVYARLNAIRQNKDDSNYVQRNINELVKMGKRDRYTRYRDIIYYTAAQMELERKNIPAAKAFLLKATAAADINMPSIQREKAFLLLGDLAFEEKNYREAKRFYDSVNTVEGLVPNVNAYNERKQVLFNLIEQADVIDRQDSLQRLAAMPEKDREVYLKKMLRQLRKSQGLKEEETPGAANVPGNLNNKQAPTDLFQTENKGEWYFNNQAVKSKGFSAFKAKWGNRQNVDNWRRSAAVSGARAVAQNNNAAISDSVVADSGELTYEGMLKTLPLTPEQMTASNDSISNALVTEGQLLMEGLEDYPAVISTLDSFPIVYSNSPRLPEALYYLYYSYKKTGDDKNATAVLQMMQEKFPGNPFERNITKASNGQAVENEKTEMTTRYDRIYNMFIEGKFEEALAEKRSADSLFGVNYWTPQLLYIESIYYIRQRDDATAKKTLQQLIELYPETAMAEKAKNMIDVLGRRKEIEEYLMNLKIERPTEDSIVIHEEKPVVKHEVVVVTKPPEPAQPEPAKQEPPKQQTQEPAKQPEPVQPKAADVKEQPKAPVVAPVIVKKDSAASTNPVARGYSYAPEASHMVVMIADNVDPIYVNESRNAFNRYNQTKFYNKTIAVTSEPLNDTTKLVLMSGFATADEAVKYMEQVKQEAAVQIIPWLPANKYSFMLISDQNLQLLKSKGSLSEYKEFLKKYFPANFK